jgi:two-component system cell cycle sensor histidine kinase/response regulator CckA
VKEMSRTRPYLGAVLITVLATLMRAALVPLIGYQLPLLTYWPAVEIVAYLFGFRPAFISVLLSLVLGRVLFIQPLHPLLFPPPETVFSSCLFVLFGASLGMFMESLRAARSEAESNAALAQDRLNQLQNEVAARQRDRNWAESVLASISEGVIAADGDGKVTYLNGLAEKLTGWTRQEAVNQPLSRVFYTIADSRFPLLSSTGGDMIPVEHSVSVIKSKQQEGLEQTLGKVLIFRDVTDRLRADEALAASEARLHASLLAAGAAAWEWNVSTGGMICSPEFRQLTGMVEIKDISFADFLESVHELDRLPLRQELARVSIKTGEFHVEYKAKSENEARWLALLGSMAGPNRMVGIVIDITERRRLEEKLRDAAKQESLGVLSGGIAHDFNNLLTSILGYSGMLKNELPAESAAVDYAANIECASKKAAHLTRQMLAYAGQGSYFREPFDLSTRLNKVIEELRPGIGPDITLERDLGAYLPVIEADPNEFDLAASGLILNAIEAIGEKTGHVLITTYFRSISDSGYDDPTGGEIPPGRYVVMTVRDTGCGMDETTKSRIFDPFFTTKFTGRGLGLAAVLGIVKGHGGVIHVESTPGVGSLFQIYWRAAFARVARAG